MKVKIKESKINGIINISASKSVAHRAFICASLANRETDIFGRISGEDVEATINALEKLGAKIDRKGETQFTVTPIPRDKTTKEVVVTLDMRSSGSSLRFLLPVVAALGIKAKFIGSKGLSERPITELINILKDKGLTVSSDTLPFEISGKILPGKYEVEGSISSQYVTGLLLALQILDGDSEIKILGEKVSKNYIDVTLNVQNNFGASILEDGNMYKVSGTGGYVSSGEYVVEGDYSSAASMFCLASIAGEIKITGLVENSHQGDEVILKVLEKMGAQVVRESTGTVVRKGRLTGVDFDAKNFPDLVPVLASTLATASGISRIYSCERLRAKESDRLTETIKLLTKYGIKCESDGSTLVITGGIPKGTTYNCPDDHRMAMAATILSSVAKEPSYIDNAECVNKSYPAFFEDFKKVGGNVNVL